jgi:CpeT protein
LVICPVAVPELGEHVLYVEQAKLDQLATPYRQRLYVVEPGADPSAQARSRVFELDRPKDFVGLCDDAGGASISIGDVDEKPGCAVELDYDAVSDTFQGGTRGHDCSSALAGASYATSEVTLNALELRSWDRGFDAGDTQVWGATDGPYVFERKTPVGP